MFYFESIQIKIIYFTTLIIAAVSPGRWDTSEDLRELLSSVPHSFLTGATGFRETQQGRPGLWTARIVEVSLSDRRVNKANTCVE